MSKAFEWAAKAQSKRSPRAKKTDGQKTAKVTFGQELTVDDYRRWKKDPGRYDIAGIDTPTVKNDPHDDVRRNLIENNVGNGEDNDTVERNKEKKTRRQRKPRNTMEYSESWWKKLPWKTDPVRASRMAMEAEFAEGIDDTSEMKAYLDDVAYDETEWNWDRDDRAAAIAYRRKMWDDYHAQDMYEMGMYSEKPEKKRKLTKTEKRDLRDAVALGVSTAGLGLSVASFALALSPKTQAEYRGLIDRTYDHLMVTSPGSLVRLGDETSAKQRIGEHLMDRGTADDLATEIASRGGKGSKVLAKQIREWITKLD